MAEKEYIEREAIIKKLREDEECDCELIVLLYDYPAADVAPVKHGHWESNEYLAGIHMTRCSECKTEFYIQDLEEISGDGFINFCPNCGARMNGGENNGINR